MPELDKIDERLRRLEVEFAKFGSVKGDIITNDTEIQKLAKVVHGHSVEWIKLREIALPNLVSAHKLLEARVKPNEEKLSWLETLKQRMTGIASVLAVLYVVIATAYPGAPGRLIELFLTVITGPK